VDHGRHAMVLKMNPREEPRVDDVVSSSSEDTIRNEPDSEVSSSDGTGEDGGAAMSVEGSRGRRRGDGIVYATNSQLRPIEGNQPICLSEDVRLGQGLGDPQKEQMDHVDNRT
jgi:hypothetical protein